MNEKNTQNKKALILNDTSIYFQHGCNKVMENLELLLRRHGFGVTATLPTLDGWESLFKTALKEADVVFVNGEGNIHHGHGEQLLKAAEYARDVSVPIYLINAVYQSNPDSFVQYLEMFDGITVRESLSHQELVTKGIVSEVIPDLSFYHPPVVGSKTIRDQGDAISDSVLSSATNSLRTMFPNRPVLPTRTTNSLAMFVDIADKTKKFGFLVRVKLFWNLIINTSLFVTKHRYTTRVATPDEYASLIASHASVIAARFHTICFALMTETPLWAIKSNSYKVEGMLSDVGLSHRVKEQEHMSPDAVPELLTKQEQEQIQYYIASAQESWDLFMESVYNEL